MNAGKRIKGDETHWHHEMIPRHDPKLLDEYIKGPVVGTKKLDSGGYEITRPVENNLELKARLQDKFGTK